MAIQWLLFSPFFLFSLTIIITLSIWLFLSNFNIPWLADFKDKSLPLHFFIYTFILSCFPQNTKKTISGKTFSLCQIPSFYEPVQGASSVWKFPKDFTISGYRILLHSFMQMDNVHLLVGDMAIAHCNSSVTRSCAFSPYSPFTAWLTAWHIIWPSVRSQLTLESGYFPRFNTNEMQT